MRALECGVYVCDSGDSEIARDFFFLKCWHEGPLAITFAIRDIAASPAQIVRRKGLTHDRKDDPPLRRREIRGVPPNWSQCNRVMRFLRDIGTKQE